LSDFFLHEQDEWWFVVYEFNNDLGMMHGLDSWVLAWLWYDTCMRWLVLKWHGIGMSNTCILVVGTCCWFGLRR